MIVLDYSTHHIEVEFISCESQLKMTIEQFSQILCVPNRAPVTVADICQLTKTHPLSFALHPPQTNPLYPSEIVQLRGTLDPQICPQNSELIAYIQSGDIWVINTISGSCKRLTDAHDENKSFSDNPLSAGVPSYVMQEEFSRYQGYWWQPYSYGKTRRRVCDVRVRVCRSGSQSVQIYD